MTSDVRAIGAAGLVATVGTLPVFILGAVAVLMGAELTMSPVQLGAAVSLFWGTAAVVAVPNGRLVERIGDRKAMALSTGGAGLVLAGLATVSSVPALLLWSAAAGAVNSLGQLAANLRLAAGVSSRRQGLGFGIKQSAPPAATLLGGMAVPLIALTVGWRWAFVASALMAAALCAVLLVRGGPPGFVRERGGGRAVVARAPLLVLAVANAFGSGANMAMAAFTVVYAVESGIHVGQAGVLAAVGSVASIGIRVLMGWLSDRRSGGDLTVVAGMLAVGAAAVAGLPLVDSWPALLLLVVVAYGVGWGWQGLFQLSVVRGNPHAPAAAGGVTQSGGSAGGALGPLTFGLLVAHFGFPTAWWAAAGTLLLAALLTVAGRRVARSAWPAAASARTVPA